MATDAVFRLAWLSDPKVAVECLHTLARHAEDYTSKGLSEWDTASVFVEPLLRGLGWDTLDVDQVNRESRREHAIADMHLLLKDNNGNRKVVVVLEVKGLGGQIANAYPQLHDDIHNELFDGPDPYNQLVRFHLADQPFTRGVLTNGRTWMIYDFDETSRELTADKHVPIAEFQLSRMGDIAVTTLVSTIGRTHMLRKVGLSKQNAPN